MAGRMSERLLRALPVPVCAAAFALAPAAASADPSAATCDARANDTPSKLVECIQTDDLKAHMQALQDIADANPGPDGMPSRNSGEPGYKASAEYVAAGMEAAGYNVTTQTEKVDYQAYTGIPSFNAKGHPYAVDPGGGPGKKLGVATA